jgi:hypothetical protein
MEQRCTGTLQVWAEPFTRLRLPKIFNLRTDPYEFADITSNTYYDWFIHRDYILFGSFIVADKFAATFKEFPIIQKPNSFNDRRRDPEAVGLRERRTLRARGGRTQRMSGWRDEAGDCQLRLARHDLEALPYAIALNANFRIWSSGITSRTTGT